MSNYWPYGHILGCLSVGRLFSVNCAATGELSGRESTFVKSKSGEEKQHTDAAAVNCFPNRQHNGLNIVRELKENPSGAAYYSRLSIIYEYM